MGKNFHYIGLIPGELNGATVTDSALQLYDSSKQHLNKEIRFERLPYNADYFNENRITALSSEDMKRLREFDQIFLGAIGDPTKIKPGVLENGILLKIRQDFDQYVNLRPIILYEGTKSILIGKDHRHINFIVCRENTEGLYVNTGGTFNEGKDNEYSIQEMKCSYQGIKRVGEYAIQLAKERKRFDKPRVHFIFKENVLTHAGKTWNRVIDEMKDTHKDVDIVYQHFDFFLMDMVGKPEKFDVVVMENFMGDGGTDLGSMISGGIGKGVSGNLNPPRIFPSMFEPIHGTAPDKWYDMKNGELVPGTYNKDLVQLIKPEGAILSFSMMLDFIGENKTAQVMKEAALNNLRDPEYETKKLDELVEQACKFAENS